jgi:hypothetical protein
MTGACRSDGVAGRQEARVEKQGGEREELGCLPQEIKSIRMSMKPSDEQSNKLLHVDRWSEIYYYYGSETEGAPVQIRAIQKRG